MFKALILLLSLLSVFGQVGFGSFNIIPTLSGSLTNGTPSPCLFTMNSLTGLVLYVDAYHSITNKAGTIASNGDQIKAWGDLSPNNYTLLNLSSSNTPSYSSTGGPTNGPCITFVHPFPDVHAGLTNGTGAITYNQPNTMFFVFEDLHEFPDNVMLNGVDNNNMQLNWSSSAQTWNIYAGNTNVGLPHLWKDFTSGASATNWVIVTIQYNGASTFIRTNGVVGFGGQNPGTNGVKGITLGSSFNGTVGCQFNYASVIWVNGPLSTNNCLAVEEMLGCEFGISVP